MKKINSNLQDLYTDLQHLVAPGSLCCDEPLSAHTTFKIGGPADIFVTPQTMLQLSQVLAAIHKAGVPLTVLGSGSNVLVLDGGIRGVVLSLSDMRETMAAIDGVLTISAGYMLKDASEFAYAAGLTGLEFAIGIPGTLGGAVFMNAGAMVVNVSGSNKVRAVDMAGQVREYSAEELAFAYRHSRFHESHEIIGEVDIRLKDGDKDEILAHGRFYATRESKQPLEYASAGSTFKRPPGYFAGTLIEQTGLKGLAVGDAEVSQKHAGFVINKGQASAEDVLNLIHSVQARVAEAHGVNLETEVRIIGEKAQK